MNIQAGAIKGGLLIAGPLPPLLGGHERQDEQNPLGGGPSNDINVGTWALGRQPYFTMYYRLPPTHVRALRGIEPYKDLLRPQHQQEPCFQDEKALR
jgi:hypothetical protein